MQSHILESSTDNQQLQFERISQINFEMQIRDDNLHRFYYCLDQIMTITFIYRAY